MKHAELVAALCRFDAGFALHAGDLSRAGALPPGRASFPIERLAFLDELASQIDGEEDSLDVEYFKQCIALERFALLELGERLKNPDVLSPLLDAATTLCFAPFSSEQERGERLRAFLRELPFFLAEAATTFSEPDSLWHGMALEVAEGLPRLFDAIAQSFRAEREASVARAALGEFTRALRALRPVEKRRLMDRETYAKLLSLKGVLYDLKEIEELGRERMAHLEEKRASLAKAFTGYPDPKNALRALEADAPESLAEAVRETQALVLEARELCGERGLLPIPSDEELRVVQAPAFLEPFILGSTLLAPKPLWPLQRSVFCVARVSARAQMRNSVAREAYPGHHLRAAVAHTQGSSWRNLPWTSARQARLGAETVQGWAHYCEATMKAQGFYRAPSDLFLACNEAVLCAHLMLLDVELATGAISLEAAAQRLVDRAGIAPARALGEVKRATLAPADNLAPTLGTHLIRALRKDAERRWGAGFSLRRFHSLIASNGSAPLAFARKRLDAQS